MKTEEKFTHLFDRQVCEEYDARTIRNAILNETDKYIMSDYPVTDEYRQKIVEYRRFLRDIPNQKGFPREIVWGEFPEQTAAQEHIEKPTKKGA